MKVLGDPVNSQGYYGDEPRGNKEHSSLIQSRNFGGPGILEAAMTDANNNFGNSASMRMSMLQTNTNKFTLGGGGGHIKNNKSINITGASHQHSNSHNFDQQSMMSTYRKKSSYHHSRNNS
jgi:hypothetical protein